MRWTGRVTRMEEMRNTQKILVDKPERIKLFGRTSHPDSCTLGAGGSYFGNKAAGA